MDEVLYECSICGKPQNEDQYLFREKGKRRKDCKGCARERANKYRTSNDGLIKEKKKAYWQENKERLKDRRKAYNEEYVKNNPEKRRQSARDWARRNRRKHVEYVKNRYNADPEFNITIKIRRRIYMALFRKRGIKEHKTVDLLGCTPAFFKKYIEALFTDGMTWEKVLSAEIHLDHIIPCARFNLLDTEEQKKCFHYTNVQPLWEQENLIKNQYG